MAEQTSLRLRSPRSWVAALLTTSALVLLLRGGAPQAGAFLAAHLPAAQTPARAAGTSMNLNQASPPFSVGGFDYYGKSAHPLGGSMDPEIEANKKKAAEMRAAYDARQSQGKAAKVTVQTALWGKRPKTDTPELQAQLAEQKANTDAAAKLRADYEAAAAASAKKGLWALNFGAVLDRDDVDSPAVQAAIAKRKDFEQRNPAMASASESIWSKLTGSANDQAKIGSGGGGGAAAAPAAAPFVPPPLTENQKKAFPR